MIVCGIDPGLSGALCFLSIDRNGVIIDYTFEDMPVRKSLKTKTGHEMDIPRLLSLFERQLSTDGNSIVGIEKQQAFPQQGVVSTFATGYGFGVLVGILTTLSIPYHIFPSQTWQKEYFAGIGRKTTKEASYDVATRLLPGCADQLYTARGRLLDGRADAALIALFTLGRTHAGNEGSAGK